MNRGILECFRIMGPLVRIPGFITSVLCPTNSNRHFPFLYNMWATGLDRRQLCTAFQISFSLSTAGTLWFLLYFWPFMSLMYIWWNSVAGVCEHCWKDPCRTSDISPQCGMIPSRDVPLSARLVLSCFPNQEDGSYDPLVLLVLVPF